MKKTQIREIKKSQRRAAITLSMKPVGAHDTDGLFYVTLSITICNI
jgi:hypothetical protein